MLVNLSTGIRDSAPTSHSLTAMDKWHENENAGMSGRFSIKVLSPFFRLLACIVFVSAALFQYSVLLKIYFGGDLNKTYPGSTASNNNVKKDDLLRRRMRCKNIDSGSLFADVIIWTIFNLVYWAVYLGDRALKVF